MELVRDTAVFYKSCGMLWEGHCFPRKVSLGGKCDLLCSMFLLCFPVAVITLGTFMMRVLKAMYEKLETVWSVGSGPLKLALLACSSTPSFSACVVSALDINFLLILSRNLHL